MSRSKVKKNTSRLVQAKQFLQAVPGTFFWSATGFIFVFYQLIWFCYLGAYQEINTQNFGWIFSSVFDFTVLLAGVALPLAFWVMALWVVFEWRRNKTIFTFGKLLLQSIFCIAACGFLVHFAFYKLGLGGLLGLQYGAPPHLWSGGMLGVEMSQLILFAFGHIGTQWLLMGALVAWVLTHKWVGKIFADQMKRRVLQPKLVAGFLTSKQPVESLAQIQLNGTTSANNTPVVVHYQESASVIEKTPRRDLPAEEESLKGPVNWRDKYVIADLENLFLEHQSGNIKLSQDALLNQARNLEQKLLSYSVRGRVTEIRPGPVITMFEMKLDEGIKISKVSSLSDDLSMVLSAQSVRIVAPIPGKDVIGIEVPNDKREIVSFKGSIKYLQSKLDQSSLPILLGKNITGEFTYTELTKMPHLLVAGATGMGKSVFINSILCSLLISSSPSKLRLILVDPKTVELSTFNDIPHLLMPVISDPNRASQSLQWAVMEMERRYELLHQFGVRNIAEYNEGVASNPEQSILPFIVIIIDELADLMMTAPKETELSIARLAQKARAAGLHLILATQRPSVDVITGMIKANFPSRIGFKVSSKIDSRTILDENGANNLLGNGDMLFMSSQSPCISRYHGAYISNSEVTHFCKSLKQLGEPVYEDSLINFIPEGTAQEGAVVEGEMDPLYDKALSIVTNYRIASVSFLQRKMGIGYNRAAKIIDQLEAQGVIGASTGNSKPREVLLNPAS